MHMYSNRLLHLASALWRVISLFNLIALFFTYYCRQSRVQTIYNSLKYSRLLVYLQCGFCDGNRK